MKPNPRRLTAQHFKYAIKTAVAAIASLGLSQVIHLAEGYWAAISAIVVMQSNIGAAVNAAWGRLAGTAIGAVVAAIVVSVWSANVISFGIAVTLTVLICVSLGLMESYRLAGVTVAIIMLVASQGSTLVLALHRFLEVSLGILVALVVSALLWPSHARSNLRGSIANSLMEMHSLLGAVVRHFRGGGGETLDEQRAKVTKNIIRNNQLLQQAMYEPSSGPVHIESLMILVENTRQIRHAVEALVLSAKESTVEDLYQKFEPEIGRLIEVTENAITGLAEGVVAWRFDSPEVDLAGAISALEKKAVAVRESGLIRSYDTKIVIPIYSFVLSLKNLALELDDAREAGGRAVYAAR